MTTGPVGRHLPALRRFARALCGSRDGGDALLRRALTALLDASPPLASGPALAARLYGALVAAWGAGGGCASEHAGEPGAVDRRLQALEPMVRAAFLLVVLEGLDERTVAAVTGLSEWEVHALVERAETALERLPATRVLILEADAARAAELVRIVTAMGHPVVGLATRADSALAQARLLGPGLLIAGAAFGDADDGAVAAILRERSVPLVTVSGGPHGRPPGRPGPVVEAPVDEERLRAAVAEALFLGDRREGG